MLNMESSASPASDSASMEQLPNELLMHIFSYLTTRALLPFTSVSHRLHDVILRLVHHRLLLAASLKDQRVILECYHPSAQYFAPQLSCTYLGTDGLSDQIEGEGSIYRDVEKTGRLGKLAGLYSRFRPVRPSEDGRRYRPHPAGDVPGHPNSSTTYPTAPMPMPMPQSSTEGQPNGAPKGVELVSQPVALDAEELFSQLCTVANLVRDAPRKGLFRSFVTIGEGVVRVWRQWLADQLAETRSLPPIETEVKGRLLDNPNASRRMLWFDTGENLGLLLRVRERQFRRNQPVLVHRDEDVPVSYYLDYEEFLVRTTQLLLKVEESHLQEDPSGKAIVFGSFR